VRVQDNATQVDPNLAKLKVMHPDSTMHGFFYGITWSLECHDDTARQGGWLVRNRHASSVHTSGTYASRRSATTLCGLLSVHWIGNL
jgi:hypothetical protein